jgi:hypothetical protein
MSDVCPVLTDKDIELISKFRKELAYLQENSDKAFGTCSIEQHGGANEVLANAIIIIVGMISAGATTGFVLNCLPQTAQLWLISLVNLKTSLPVCTTSMDYAMSGVASYVPGAAGIVEMTCAVRAQLLEQGINRLMILVGGLTGVALSAKIKELLGATGGNRRRKSRKARKARKARKSRKY